MALVTVIMPVFNTKAFVVQAVESILAQSLRDFRFVAVDDGSRDGSGELLDRFAPAGLTVLHQHNRGLGVSLNEALSICETEFVARMDSDDVATPNRLESQLAFMQTHPDVGLLGTQVAYMTTDGRRGSSPPLPCGHEDICSDLRRGRHAIVHASVMMRTELVRQVGAYRIAGSGQDLDLFLRLADVSRLANLREIGLLVRLHQGSTTATSQSLLKARYAYAIHCARQRRAALPEPHLDEFLAAWEDRSRWRRLPTRLDNVSLNLYRQAIDAAARNKRVSSYWKLAVAALCSPARTYQRLSRSFRRRRPR